MRNKKLSIGLTVVLALVGATLFMTAEIARSGAGAEVSAEAQED